THNQSIIIDVGDRVVTICPSFQGYIVVFAEQQCTALSPSFVAASQTCTTATGGTLSLGEFGPISYNQLYVSYALFYNVAAAPGICPGGFAGEPCAPPATGPFPDVEAANAIAFESPQPMFSFLGNDTGGALQLSFGTTTAFDYVALPAGVQAGFAA